MNIGSPWVYIFSRFTSEALLFEALAIFSLSAVYTGFWLLRKRKYGVAHHEVPAGVVKYYLNELIVDAEQIRAQLFGLLAGHGIQATPLAGVNLGLAAQPGASAAFVAAASPQAAQTLVVLETKIAEQAKQIEVFVAEKTKVEKELVEVKAAKNAGVASGGDANALAKLQEKIALLEGKLSEYSVIEDDLANLKRLQQENTALKAQIAGKGATVTTAAAPAPSPTPSAAVAPEAPAPVAATPTPAPSVQSGPSAAALAAAAVQASETVVEPAAPETAGAVSTEFEGLVDQVEQSLAQPETAAAAPASEAPSTTAPAAATIEKSDADLVAEFEKMLNG